MRMACVLKKRFVPSVIGWLFLIPLLSILGACADTGSLDALEEQFRTLPMAARHQTGPLFWLHGEQSEQRLQMYLDKVVEGGNGCFVAESRLHSDWLGPDWYRDLAICLDAAKKHDLKMWIFDERGWPSGKVDGKVPQQYGSKYIEADAGVLVEGPTQWTQPIATDKLVAVIAGRSVDDGVDGESLVDLTDHVRGGKLAWNAPAGRWSVMTFTWRYSDGLLGRVLVDGASRDAVDWYIRTVYQPHYDHFGDDFGKTIVGYFYDEPETFGDWGTEVLPELKRRGVDWKRALVAWKSKLADPDEQVAARYEYQEAFAEAWGRTLFGGLSQWCRERGVLSIGHFLEHRKGYLDSRHCAGNIFQLQKYSGMGGIDAVFDQFVMGRRLARDVPTWQTPKLGSSISHVYGKPDDITMVEIFGARGQDLSYPEMKWWTNHMHVSGLNFFIPHSFNPRSPADQDSPPYFYNGGYEPRWPLYRVYADYTTRLNRMLTGGRHVCPVAFLFLGHSYHAGRALMPEDMTSALQDARFDCDWMPYDVFEKDVSIVGTQLRLRQERYKILVVPAVEVIPYEALAKVKAFFDAGGTVLGYGMLPTRSATLGKTSDDITGLRRAIWGDAAEPGPKVCRVNNAGGRSYFLPERPTSALIQQVLTTDAGIHPALEVLDGDPNDWLHVLHRVKAERDLFLVCNQNHEGVARRFTFRLHAQGVPEIWDAMRNQITHVPYQRVDDDTVDLTLTLEPLESILIVFQPEARKRPLRFEPGDVPQRTLAVKRLPTPADWITPTRPKRDATAALLTGASWVWPTAEPVAQPPASQYFRGSVDVDSKLHIDTAGFYLAAEARIELYVDGKRVKYTPKPQPDGPRLQTLGLRHYLKAGVNHLTIEVTDFANTPNPAALIGRLYIHYDNGTTVTHDIDGQWKTSDQKSDGWQRTNFDDRAWSSVKAVALYGQKPWGDIERLEDRMTLSRVQDDPFLGRFELPENWLQNNRRIYLEVDDLQPEAAAAVRLNGRPIGGFIGKPYRLELTDHLHPGENTLEIRPFAPAHARIVQYTE